MIHTARFGNFKALRDVRVTLSPFTAIVGPNASGKTSVLQGLQYLTFLGLGDPILWYRGIDHPGVLRSAGASGPMLLSIAGAWDAREGSVQLVFSDSVHPQGRRREWDYQVEGIWEPKKFERGETLEPHGFSDDDLSQRNAAYLGFASDDGALLRRLGLATSFLRLDPVRLAQPSYSDRLDPLLDFDGTGLASVLAHMALTDPDSFQALQAAFRAVIPAVRRIRIDRAPVRRIERDSGPLGSESASRSIEREYWGHRITLDMEGSPGTPAEAVSEGTMLVLGLLTALMSGTQKDLVLLDDLDRGLHPKAMGTLVSQLRALQAKREGLQIVATTHSPYLIDQFKAQEVRLTTTAPDGSVVCGSLDEHPDFPRWKDAMLPGEFWSTVGEQWLNERGKVAHAAP